MISATATGTLVATKPCIGKAEHVRLMRPMQWLLEGATASVITCILLFDHDSNGSNIRKPLRSRKLVGPY